jgi:hypothetical protein
MSSDQWWCDSQNSLKVAAILRTFCVFFCLYKFFNHICTANVLYECAALASKDSFQALAIKELDDQIQVKERELRPLRWHMEEYRLKFLRCLEVFAAKWFDETARFCVTKYPEVTFSLPHEEIATMKAKVMQLQHDVDRIVKAAFSDPAIWWHQAPSVSDSFDQYEQLGNNEVGNRFPRKIDDPVRVVLGVLGVILQEFGFNVTSKPVKAAYPEFWFTPRMTEVDEVKPYFPHLLVWSEDMQYALQKYNTQFKQAIVLFIEIQKLKEEKKRQQACSLWDSY